MCREICSVASGGEGRKTFTAFGVVGASVSLISGLAERVNRSLQRRIHCGYVAHFIGSNAHGY